MNTEEFQRKLTAILSADVQGYSRLMGEDEDSTVRTLTAYRALMISLIQKHRGHVVDTPGDNLLAKFGSVMDAVRCAVEIQEELRIRNAELPENRKMQFRIGINLGDVIEEGDRIYGDGINVAARIEGLSEGGGICVSGTVYDSIRNKLSMSYESLGEHNVKNIKDPVRVYRIKIDPEPAKAAIKEKNTGISAWQRVALSATAFIILGVVAVWYFAFRHAPVISDVEETPKTIAVLPFDDLSPEKDQEYFVAGLTDEISNCIGKIPELIVTGMTSSFTFKGSNKTVQEITNILGVENVLVGSVRKAGERLRITAKLLKGSDGSQLWSETYDRELKDIFVIQEEISIAVADELKLTLGIGESLKQLGGTDNEEAYQQYLVALGKRGINASDTTLAIESLDMALELDPKFALAWAEKAAAHAAIAQMGPSNRATSELDAALRAVQRAMELEPKLGITYYHLGYVKTNKGEWVDAELAFRKALELSTGKLSESGVLIANHYMAVGCLKKAVELLGEVRQNDPLNPIPRGMYILNLGLLGDLNRAEEEYALCKELFGEKWGAGDTFITMARVINGNVDITDRIINSDPISNTAIEHLGSPEEALAALQQIYDDSETISVWDIFTISMWAAYFHDYEFCMGAFEKALEINAPGTIAAGMWSPVLNEMRQLPRFKEFVGEIGLVDYWEKFEWPDLCHPTDDGDFECD